MTCIEVLPYANCSIFIISFNPHNRGLERFLLLSPFSGWGNPRLRSRSPLKLTWKKRWPLLEELKSKLYINILVLYVYYDNVLIKFATRQPLNRTHNLRSIMKPVFSPPPELDVRQEFHGSFILWLKHTSQALKNRGPSLHSNWYVVEQNALLNDVFSMMSDHWNTSHSKGTR